MGINKVILIGNLGKDPEVRYTSSQTAVCTLSVATTERRKDQDGNWNDKTEWHRVVTFGRTAENCSQYLKKGRQVYVEGRIQTNKWQDKNGQDRYTTEVVAFTVQFLGGGAGRGSDTDTDSGMTVENKPETSSEPNILDSLPSADAIDNAPKEVNFEDDDIPF